MRCFGVLPRSDVCVTTLRRRVRSSRFPNVWHNWRDVTAADSRPVHFTRGKVPKRNETFGCEIRNLTESIKAERTVDAKRAARPKWWLPISYQVYHISLCLQLCSQPSKSPVLFGHRFLLFVLWDTLAISDKSNNWRCHSFWPITCWEILEPSLKN